VKDKTEKGEKCAVVPDRKYNSAKRKGNKAIEFILVPSYSK